jgi:hypothetical protein
MTRIQKLEERIRLDDRMCADINALLNSHGYSGRELAEALGKISCYMMAAGRREDTWDIERKGRAGETEKAAG